MSAAKFANLEPDLDPNPLASVDKISASLDGTGAVGTYFYTAPEIVQGWPHIDEKVTPFTFMHVGKNSIIQYCILLL